VQQDERLLSTLFWDHLVEAVVDSVVADRAPVSFNDTSLSVGGSGNTVSMSSTSTDPNGGVFGVGGGVHIDDRGSGTIQGSLISGNRVTSTGYTGFAGDAAGGIDDDHLLTLLDSTVRDNHVSSAITSNSTSASSIADGGGMGVDSPNGSATIKGTTLSGNSATATSPAALLGPPSPNGPPTGTLAFEGALAVFGTVTMIDSTVTGNQAGATTTSGSVGVGGGGIANLGILSLKDTAVSDNTTIANGPGGDTKGGGIWNDSGGGPPPQLTLIDSTITHNSLTGNPGVNKQGGGVYNGTSNGATLTATNTLISQNTPDNCYPPNTIPGCSG
jgi:hypothetical protein